MTGPPFDRIFFKQRGTEAENQTAEYPRHETIVSLFEAQAEKMPDQIAAVMSANECQTASAHHPM
jgi:non-ribosomal peptide synthetase component F